MRNQAQCEETKMIFRLGKLAAQKDADNMQLEGWLCAACGKIAKTRVIFLAHITRYAATLHCPTCRHTPGFYMPPNKESGR